MDRVDPDDIDAVARAPEAGRIKARDKYMGTLLLLKSNPKRYGGLVADVINNYTRGIGGYPRSLTKAYRFLTDYHPHQLSRRINEQEGSVSFTTLDDTNDQGG